MDSGSSLYVRFKTLFAPEGKKQIFASLLIRSKKEDTQEVVRITTGLLDPNEATEARAAVQIIEELELILAKTKVLFERQGLVLPEQVSSVR